jgi:M6 family metalloprotease-like protein
MKLKLFALALAAMTIATASAVPAKRITKTITQPDGTTVAVTQVGDERFHALVTSDGLTVDITPEGYAVYRSTDGITNIYAHEVGQRTTEEKALIADKSTSLTFQAAQAASPSFQAMKDINRPSEVKMTSTQGKISIEQGSSQVPHKGVAKVPVLLAQYTDIKFSGDDPKADFQAFFEGEENSAHAYFYEMSQGQYDPQFEVYGPYTLSHNRQYYGGTGSWGNDEKPGHMAREAAQLANAEVDFSEFDNNNDGYCDVLIILYAGVGQASSGVNEAVWPCRWTLASSGAGTLTCDGVVLNDFAVFNELNGRDTSKIDGIGTFCHEFSHCLGLPDFYETTYANGYYGMDAWSLMDYGCYNNNTYTPVGYSAYEKGYMGWMQLTEGESDTQYSLPIQNNPENTQDYALCLVNKKDKNEYFIFENRAKQGWDKYIDDEGMLITHVTYSASAWSGNTVNNYMPQRMTVVPADNVLSSATNNADLWPKTYATEFTNSSKPSAKVNSGGYLNIPVTEIQRDDDGIVSLWVDKKPIPTLDTPELMEPTDVESNSFTANWSPIEIEGTDVTYDLQAWERSDAALSPKIWADFTNNGMSNTDWDIAGYAKIYSTYALIGTASQYGSITSKETIAPEDGVVTVVAKARRYNSDDSRLVISLLSDSGSLISSQATALAADTTYTSVMFSELDNSKQYKIQIGNAEGQQRLFLYNAMAFSGDCADDTDEAYDEALSSETENLTGNDDQQGDNVKKAPAREPEITTSGKHIFITGITDNSFTLTELTGSNYSYRVKAVPADPKVAEESGWSTIKTIDLPPTSGINNVIADITDAAAAVPVAYYNQAGMQLSGPQQGINIVRYSNGDVRKIIIRK